MIMDSEEYIESDIRDRYTIHVLLGKGAYGIVWKAEEKKSGRIVALKKVIGAFNNDIDAHRTYREVFLLYNTIHINVVRLFNVFRAKNDYDIYLVFEYVHTDLSQLIYDESLSDDHKVYISYQMLVGLAYLHSKGVVHRDLKPLNILVNSDCIVKIADLGLARIIDDPSPSYVPVLTPYVATKLYRSPEVMLGSTDYTYSTDMFSIGCILAEMFSHKPQVLLQSNTIIEQLEKYFSLFGTPDRSDLDSINISQSLLSVKHLNTLNRMQLSSIVGNNKHLIDLIHRCMEFNPAKRISPLDALKHPFFTQSHLSKRLSAIPVPAHSQKIPPLLLGEAKLSAPLYRKLLYQLILSKKEEKRREKEKIMNARSEDS